MDYSRILCNPPTVPYLPVTPTLRVRFVYEIHQLRHEEIVHGSLTIVNVEKCQRRCAEQVADSDSGCWYPWETSPTSV